MSVARTSAWSLRLEQAESSRLAWAFAISLAFHCLFFGGYYAGKKLNLWQNLHWPAWLRPVQTLVERLKKKDPPQPLQPDTQEVPLMFVDVSPQQETPEPPKNAQYYSSRNSQAANPDPAKETDTPKISGIQTEMVKTEDIPKQNPVPLQPSAPVPPAPPEPERKPLTPAQPRGDLTMAKPAPEPKKEEGQETKPKPRTFKEAMLRQQNENRLVGQKMKQDGGVKRRLDFSSLNAKATPFGSYDAALIEAVQYRWYTLLDQREYASDSRGKVVLTFRLHYDGRVTDLTLVENTVGEVLGLICEKAISDPAPFPPWPTDMRLANHGDVRDIQFTFYYN